MVEHCQKGTSFPPLPKNMHGLCMASMALAWFGLRKKNMHGLCMACAWLTHDMHGFCAEKNLVFLSCKALAWFMNGFSMAFFTNFEKVAWVMHGFIYEA